MNPFSEVKAIAGSFYESYNHRNVEESFDHFVATDLINHSKFGGSDREKWLNFDKAFLAACPDLTVTVNEQFVEGNKVVTHWSCQGTHTTEFLGRVASGNPIQLSMISIDKIENGKIKEHFAIADFAEFIQQFSKK